MRSWSPARIPQPVAETTWPPTAGRAHEPMGVGSDSVVGIAAEMVHWAPAPSPSTPAGAQVASPDGFELFDLDEGQIPGPDEVESALGHGGPVWVRSMDPGELASVAQRLLGLGLPRQQLVLECPPGAVGRLAAGGWLAAVCPDDLGAEPGGALEAVVTRALADGARVVRSRHTDEVRRAMHITSALLLERQGSAP